MLLITVSFKVCPKAWPLAQVRSQVVFSPDLVYSLFLVSQFFIPGKNSCGHTVWEKGIIGNPILGKVEELGEASQA